VVMHHDAEILGRRHDLLGHLDIGAARRRVARGMIVHEHDRRRRQLERPLHHLSYIDRGVIDGALLLHLIGDDLVALVEEQDAEFRQALESTSARPTSISEKGSTALKQTPPKLLAGAALQGNLER
jgi:hypothetical protein